MKKIVKGNDFSLAIPMARVDGETREALDLTQCTDIAVRLCSAYRRIVLEHSIEGADKATLVARVEGEQLSLGTYAIEVVGKVNGNDWRTYDCGAIQIVECNHDADSDLGDIIEGDRIEMDEASVVSAAPLFAPKGEWAEGTQYHRGDVVWHGVSSWWAAEDNTGEPPSVPPVGGSSSWVCICKGVGIEDATVVRNRLVVTL